MHLSYPDERIGYKFISSQSELFRFTPISVSEPMRIIPNQSENPEINPNRSDLGFIRIDSDWKLGFGLVRINSDCWLGLNQIRSDRFLTIFHKIPYKTFFGLVQNDSHWLAYRYRNESK